MVTLTVDELADMQDRIAKGELPRDAIQKHFDAEARNVFGHDAKKVKGQFVEQGIGSAAQPSRNSVESYRKRCTAEPDYERHLARMEKELAEYEARQRASVAQ